MKRFTSIEVAVYDQISHSHRQKLADLLCEGDTRPYDSEITRAFNFYGMEADYPLMLDYAVHSLAEHEFAEAPKSSPFQVGPTIFWRRTQAG